MTYFEYAAIYFGIIVGLALSNILMSVHKLVEAASRVRWHWMAPATAIYAATVTLGSFWSLWVRRDTVSHHTFLTSLPTAIALGLLFLTCAASLPDDVPEQGIDLKAYYFDNRKRFWGFSSGTHVLNLLTWLFALVEFGFHGKTLAQSLYPMVGNGMEAAVSLSLVFVRAPWWHAVGIASLWIFSLFYFGPMLLN